MELIIVRGGGDLATGTIHRLYKAGFPVLVLETEYPAAIRRQVSFSEAIYEGTATVEGVTAKRIDQATDWKACFLSGFVPIMIDPDGKAIEALKPDAVVDAIIAKKNLGTNKSMANLTIALGPGFEAGVDVDYVVETKRGHNLGRVIENGLAAANSGVPGVIAGFGKERVIHAEYKGVIKNVSKVGETVNAGDTIAYIVDGDNKYPVPATISGLLRGLIRDGYPVKVGFKIADIDPRLEEYDNCFTISDKARCIAGSVLEIVCREVLK